MAGLARLTDAMVRKAIPESKHYKLADGGGLFVKVCPNGAKYWRYRFRLHGVEQEFALGSYPDLSLQQARIAHMAARTQVAAGTNPVAARKIEKLTAKHASRITFEAVAREFWEERQKLAGRSPGYIASVIEKMQGDLFPWIGERPISQITTPELLGTLTRIEARAPETARRMRTHSGQVFRYAIQTGRATVDPTESLRGAIISRQSSHFAAITTPAAFADLLRKMYTYRGDMTTRCLLRMSALVFQRPTELREALWEEFDLEGSNWGAPMWEIPAYRAGAMAETKISQTGWESHLVPLSRQVVSILQQLRPLTGRSGMVFRSPLKPSQPLSAGAPLMALKRLGYCGRMTAHGFRASARTLAAERLKVAPDLLELQISHKVVDPLGRSYNRTEFLQERVQFMQDWAGYLDTLASGASVAVLTPAR